MDFCSVFLWLPFSFSLYMSVQCMIFGNSTPSHMFSVSSETFLSASNRLLFTVYFCRKTFWQKTKATCHQRVYIKVLSPKLDLYHTLEKSLNETGSDFFHSIMMPPRQTQTWYMKGFLLCFYKQTSIISQLRPCEWSS